MQDTVYSVKRVAVAAFKVDIDGFLNEKRRINYVFDFEDNYLRIQKENFLTFLPAGISCYLNGQYHYTGRFYNKPSAPQFHNLQKHVSNSKY